MPMSARTTVGDGVLASQKKMAKQKAACGKTSVETPLELPSF
jgi:hypothetical protein